MEPDGFISLFGFSRRQLGNDCCVGTSVTDCQERGILLNLQIGCRKCSNPSRGLAPGWAGRYEAAQASLCIMQNHSIFVRSHRSSLMLTLRIWLACMKGVKHSWRALSGAKRDTTSMMRPATAALIVCSENQRLWPFSMLPPSKGLFAVESKRFAPGRLLYSLIQVSSPLESSSKLLKANRPGCPMNLERYTIFYAKEYMFYKHGPSKVNLKKFKRAYKEI